MIFNISSSLFSIIEFIAICALLVVDFFHPANLIINHAWCVEWAISFGSPYMYALSLSASYGAKITKKLTPPGMFCLIFERRSGYKRWLIT